MGYRDGVKGLWVWSPSERKVILIRDVIFDELSMLHSKSDKDLGKAKDVTKLVEFESSIIKKHKWSKAHLSSHNLEYKDPYKEDNN